MQTEPMSYGDGKPDESWGEVVSDFTVLTIASMLFYEVWGKMNVIRRVIDVRFDFFNIQIVHE